MNCFLFETHILCPLCQEICQRHYFLEHLSSFCIKQIQLSLSPEETDAEIGEIKCPICAGLNIERFLTASSLLTHTQLHFSFSETLSSGEMKKKIALFDSQKDGKLISWLQKQYSLIKNSSSQTPSLKSKHSECKTLFKNETAKSQTSYFMPNISYSLNRKLPQHACSCPAFFLKDQDTPVESVSPRLMGNFRAITKSLIPRIHQSTIPFAPSPLKQSYTASSSCIFDSQEYEEELISIDDIDNDDPKVHSAISHLYPSPSPQPSLSRHPFHRDSPMPPSPLKFSKKKLDDGFDDSFKTESMKNKIDSSKTFQNPPTPPPPRSSSSSLIDISEPLSPYSFNLSILFEPSSLDIRSDRFDFEKFESDYSILFDEHTRTSTTSESVETPSSPPSPSYSSLFGFEIISKEDTESIMVDTTIEKSSTHFSMKNTNKPPTSSSSSKHIGSALYCVPLTRKTSKKRKRNIRKRVGKQNRKSRSLQLSEESEQSSKGENPKKRNNERGIDVEVCDESDVPFVTPFSAPSEEIPRPIDICSDGEYNNEEDGKYEKKREDAKTQISIKESEREEVEKAQNICFTEENNSITDDINSVDSSQDFHKLNQDSFEDEEMKATPMKFYKENEDCFSEDRMQNENCKKIDIRLNLSDLKRENKDFNREREGKSMLSSFFSRLFWPNRKNL